LIKDQIKMY